MTAETERRDGAINGALATGIIGTTLGVLNGGLGLFNTTRTGTCQQSNYVTKDEFNMGQALAAKDSEIALLKSENNTEVKIVDTYKVLAEKINNLNDKVQANKDEQYQVNTAQAVFNGTTTSTLGCLQNQINSLNSITKVVVPNTAVCPGWGNVTIAPAVSAT